MSDIQMPMKFKVEMDGPMVVQTMDGVLQQWDEDANVVMAEMIDKGKGADLTGCTAEGYLMHADGGKVPLETGIEGSTVKAELNEKCYEKAGGCTIVIRLKDEDGVKRTILRVTGYIESEAAVDE